MIFSDADGDESHEWDEPRKSCDNRSNPAVGLYGADFAEYVVQQTYLKIVYLRTTEDVRLEHWDTGTSDILPAGSKLKVVGVEDWNNDSRDTMNYYYAEVIVLNSRRDLKGSVGMVDLNKDNLIVEEEKPFSI